MVLKESGENIPSEKFNLFNIHQKENQFPRMEKQKDIEALQSVSDKGYYLL